MGRRLMAAVRRGACQWSRKEGSMLMWRLEGREGSEAKLAASESKARMQVRQLEP